MGEAEQRHARRHMLNRQQWLQLIVRIAMRKNLSRGELGTSEGDVAKAVDTLLRTSLLPRLPAEALQSSDAFRRETCYRELTDRTLRKHLHSLRNVYAAYAAMKKYAHGAHGDVSSAKMMSIGEWLDLLAHMRLFQMRLLSLHAAKRIFLCSRIRSVSDYSDRSEVLMRHLHFEDFLEAFVRIACVVAFPSAEEILASGAADAGEFLVAFCRHHPTEYGDFVSLRSGTWQTRDAPHQPAHVCVDHLASLFFHIVDTSLESRGIYGRNIHRGDQVVSAEEARLFLKRNEEEPAAMDAASKTRAAAMHKSQRSNGHVGATSSSDTKENLFANGSLLAALDSVRAHVREALRKVHAFGAMSEAQRETLREAMSVAKFEAGDTIFEQGDVGTAFYVITTGEARVVRVHPDDPDQEERVLAQLTEGACFGERALLRKDFRFATVTATSRLFTLFIERDRFEQALGPLNELVPDTYDK